MTTRFIPIDRLDKNQKYIIVGIPKCGTTSLGKYLTDKGYDVIERELQFYDIDSALNHNYYDRTPIIITRNPKQAYKSQEVNFGYSMIFQYGLQMWDTLIYSLEYLKTIPDFPHENKTIKKEMIMEQI